MNVTIYSYYVGKENAEALVNLLETKVVKEAEDHFSFIQREGFDEEKEMIDFKIRLENRVIGFLIKLTNGRKFDANKSILTEEEKQEATKTFLLLLNDLIEDCCKR